MLSLDISSKKWTGGHQRKVELLNAFKDNWTVCLHGYCNQAVQPRSAFRVCFKTIRPITTLLQAPLISPASLFHQFYWFKYKSICRYWFLHQSQFSDRSLIGRYFDTKHEIEFWKCFLKEKDIWMARLRAKNRHKDIIVDPDEQMHCSAPIAGIQYITLRHINSAARTTIDCFWRHSPGSDICVHLW